MRRIVPIVLGVLAVSASAFAQAVKTVPPLSALRSPFGARITRTFSFSGAQMPASVGPKSKTHFAPAAAAN